MAKEDRDKYREQWKRGKEEGKKKKHVNPSAMLKGQVWTVWQRLRAGSVDLGRRT